MDDRDTTELMTAFAVGTLIGVGVMLMFRSEPEPARVLRRIERKGKELGKGTRRSGEAAAEMSLALVETGRKVASALREEVEEIVADAREELARAVGDPIATAGRRMRRRARAVRRR